MESLPLGRSSPRRFVSRWVSIESIPSAVLRTRYSRYVRTSPPMQTEADREPKSTRLEQIRSLDGPYAEMDQRRPSGDGSRYGSSYLYTQLPRPANSARTA